MSKSTFSKMNLSFSLEKSGRKDMVMRSIISNVCKEIYKEKRKRDIEIHAVKIQGKKITVSTWIPLLNSELMMLSWEIKKASCEKLWKLWIRISEESSIFFV